MSYNPCVGERVLTRDGRAGVVEFVFNATARVLLDQDELQPVPAVVHVNLNDLAPAIKVKKKGD